MELTKSPADFASAHADNLFSFVDVDETSLQELIYYNANDEMVAIRRYVGCNSIDTSPKSILLRMLSPAPLANITQCGFLRPEGRDAMLSLEYDGGEALTPMILFTSSHHNHTADSIMGSWEQWRTIAPGECDEVAFCLSEGATIVANVSAGGRSQMLGSFTATTKGVVLFALSADDILSRAPLAADSSAFELRFAIGGRLCALIKYRLRSPHHSDVRLAWLNREGGISYHTFRLAERRLHRSSVECASSSGREVVSAESWVEQTLQSEVLSQAQTDQLSELFSSANLWICDNEGIEPQILLSSELLLEGEGARRITLSVRSAKSLCVSR